MKPKEVAAYFTYATDFIAARVGRHNIVSAVVHMDEETPHMHLTFVPLTQDNRLSAKEILGNRADLSRWQDDFHAHMIKQYLHLERGELSRETGRRHIPMRVFKQAVRLEKQAQRVEALLTDKSPIGAGKRKEEALFMLTKMWPQMAGFESQLKKYAGTIRYLQQENAQLAEEAAAGRENRMDTRMQIAALQSRLHYLERFKAAVPEEARRLAEASMKRGGKNKTR